MLGPPSRRALQPPPERSRRPIIRRRSTAGHPTSRTLIWTHSRDPTRWRLWPVCSPGLRPWSSWVTRSPVTSAYCCFWYRCAPVSLEWRCRPGKFVTTGGTGLPCDGNRRCRAGDARVNDFRVSVGPTVGPPGLVNLDVAVRVGSGEGSCGSRHLRISPRVSRVTGAPHLYSWEL